jgi:hypothetical protein
MRGFFPFDYAQGQNDNILPSAAIVNPLYVRTRVAAIRAMTMP